MAECISNSSPMNPVIGLMLAALAATALFAGASWLWDVRSYRKLLGRKRRG